MSIAETALPPKPSTSQPSRMSADEFDALGDTSGLELVDGVVLRKPMSEISGWVGTVISTILFSYAREHGGRAYGDDTDYRCFPNPSQTRKPDASYITASRVQPMRTGPCRVVPDLAVEVVSPNDNLVRFNKKLADYRQAGVPLVWIIDPFSRTVRIIDATDRTERTLGETDTLDGGTVLPGLSIEIAELLVDEADIADPDALPKGDD